MPTSISSDVRATIKTAINSVAANVYDFVPETPQVPFVALVPSAPYMEFESIGRNLVRLRLNLILTCGVAYLSNSASLDNLAKLVISVLQALPAGYELSVVERPEINPIGTSNVLTADIRLSVRYEQTV